MTDIILIPAVGIGRVEERDAGVERFKKHFDAARLVAVAFRRETHASEAYQGDR